MKHLDVLQADFQKVAALRPILKQNKGALPDAAQDLELRAILASVDFPEQCERFVESCEGELFAWMVGTGELDQAIDTRLATHSGNQAFLRECVNQFSDLLARSGIEVSKPEIVFARDMTRDATTGNTKFWPLNHPELDEITINTVRHRLDVPWPPDAPGSYIDPSFEEDVPLKDAILTTCHEMRHIFHANLCRAYFNCRLNEGDGFFEAGKYFRELFRLHNQATGYIQTEESCEFNKLQLDERCAYRTGKRMADKIEAYLARKPLPAFAAAMSPAVIAADLNRNQAQMPVPAFI